jgi:hypothetical protein
MPENYKVDDFVNNKKQLEQKIREAKEFIAGKHDFYTAPPYNGWGYAMLVTNRTRLQIQMYEELCELLASELIK